MKLPSLFNISALAFVISIFSLSFLSVGLQLNTSTQVLGESTQRNNVSCVEINQLFNQISLMQRKYCSVTPTTVPRPSVFPTPLPTTSVCKTGVNSFGVYNTCQNGFLNAYFVCYDGYRGELGDGVTCQSSELWRIMADKACYGRTSCGLSTPTPTPEITRIIISSPPQRPTVTPTPVTVIRVTGYPSKVIEPPIYIDPQPPRD